MRSTNKKLSETKIDPGQADRTEAIMSKLVTNTTKVKETEKKRALISTKFTIIENK